MKFGISRSLAIIIMSLKMELKSILQIHFRGRGHIHLHLHYPQEFMEQYSLKKGKIKAIRHVISPEISMSFSPDFTKPKFGYYEKCTNK